MLPIILTAAVILADQAVKIFCAQWLITLNGNTFVVIKDVFHLTYIENRGAAFGMLQNARWLFITVTFIACAVLVFLLIRDRKKMHTLMRVCFALILAGALGNLIDRVFLGYVRDMFYFVPIDFPVFNVADSAITIGFVILILDVLFFKGKDYFEIFFSSDKKARGGNAPENQV